MMALVLLVVRRLISGTKALKLMVLKYIFLRVISSLISDTKVLKLLVLKHIFESHPAPCAHIFFFFGQLKY
jgi:hypothetical protein